MNSTNSDDGIYKCKMKLTSTLLGENVLTVDNEVLAEGLYGCQRDR